MMLLTHTARRSSPAQAREPLSMSYNRGGEGGGRGVAKAGFTRAVAGAKIGDLPDQPEARVLVLRAAHVAHQLQHLSGHIAHVALQRRGVDCQVTWCQVPSHVPVRLFPASQTVVHGERFRELVRTKTLRA